ncbi:MAG: hypothetical protein DRN15_10555 [Thermoprotei archaeon]|nr:MAG: hypothetical protein DRM97_07910 [Thermoprotei archaeon]RLF21789.1 MAG: hypothetical protein DRN15_10555 [Thermoprotei archaeon]
MNLELCANEGALEVMLVILPMNAHDHVDMEEISGLGVTSGYILRMKILLVIREHIWKAI